MKFINIGFNNVINADRVIAVTGADSSPAKRLITDAKNSGRAIDCTCGRKTRSIIIMDSDHIILTALQNETISARLSGENDSSEDEIDE